MDETFIPPVNPPGSSIVFISFQRNRRVQHQSTDVDADLTTVLENGGEEEDPSWRAPLRWGPVSGPAGVWYLVRLQATLLLSHGISSQVVPGCGTVMTPFMLNVDSGTDAFLTVVLTRF